ncbi:extensin family protein [Sphingomonas sp. PP-CE-1G-424]|uniref:extensin family protein n=1 Tax=Sphingomonas sp. PP-CE-1G-424 TaxID=2135658 RepID=UPI0010D8D4AB|nr:extensin family protein [Sphingomonas sp. PP-CE-1G-424]TCP72691.1 extensin-like protein [Sphingomonas sp. PP-CE-1G-424]
MYRVFYPLLVILALAACGRADRPTAPTQTRPNLSVPSNRETAQCLADLRELHVSFQVLPDRETGPGCGLAGTVKLVDIGVPVANLTAVRCGAARAFIGWTRNAVAPAAYQMLGSELARVDSMGSYACRNVVGSTRGPTRRSGHAIANAIDVGGFVLKDGRRITVLNDWNSPDPQVRQFLQTIHASACKRFGTVLSPDYNAAHRNHLHLEDDHANFCR